MKIGICGICGRMGAQILYTVIERGHVLAGAFDSPGAANFGKSACSLVQKDDISVNITSLDRNVLKDCDGCIDFSTPAATLKLVELSVALKKPLVIGTTGFSESQSQCIREASRDIPVLMSPNMSVGVNLLFKLTEIASAALSDVYDVEIFEAHHKYKKDAPSGTAQRLVEIVRTNKKGLESAAEITGRQGISDGRNSDEIGVFAIRAGDIVGEHTVFFAGSGERIELTHRAANRNTFSTGAVLALEFLAGQGPGLYTMFDVLGL